MPKIPKIIPQLVEKFQHNLNEYKNPKYHEAHIRVEFVNPFFKALGWDVDNEAGYAFAYRDVIHEDEVKVGGATKAPDYSFRIGGTRKFFLETKKPSIDLKHDPSPAFQLRRYAYSAKLPVSILTDFEEFIVFDCRIKPTIDDKPSVGRVMYLTYEEYVDKWMEISSIFSRESVLRGDFDRFTEGTRKKRGTAEIDKDFLADLDRWRILFAKNIALRNKSLSQREINWAVQLTIDRLIFLRMSEDRGIENQYTLQALQNGTSVYNRLVEIFYQADERYNSGLFHFQKKDGPHPDELTPELKIDDKVIKEIVSELYYPKCPYEFSVLPVEVLGHAYEQFLGKVIRLTEGHRAKIEEKPEVRKAGGVYYTPKYIVDYIVENTVGKLLEGKEPKDVRDLHILDPACGSGSFLLGAFQCLMDWHLDWYTKEYEKTDSIPTVVPEKGKRKKRSDPQAIYQGQGGQWYLSTAEKKRILTNNIFGVDIDANAVEVTKLSLLLKVLENESSETINSQLKMWHERALPNLSNNIKCGNSLIGPDFYENQQSAMFDEEEALRINAFDWEQEFPEIFKKGGFDAVIGNPPWIDIKGMDQQEVDYFFSKYKTTQNRMNIYATFLHIGAMVTKSNGYLGYITPNSFYTQSSYSSLRRFLITEVRPIKIVRMPDKTFQYVNIESTITIFYKDTATKVEVHIFHDDDILKKIDFNKALSNKTINVKRWLKSKDNIFNIFVSDQEEKILNKIENDCKPLVEICDFSLGITPYDKYKGHTEKEIKSKVFHANHKKNVTFKPLLSGKDIKRYLVTWNNEKWLSYGEWLGAPREKRFFIEPRILIRQIISGHPLRIYAGYTEEELYNTQTIFNILLKDSGHSIFQILAILNSKLMTFYHRCRFLDQSKKTFQKILIQDAKDFPIQVKVLDIDDNTIDREVMQILSLRKKLVKGKNPRIQQQLQRRINATDRKIDQLVYELYGLTEEEIKVVEESVG